MRTLKRLAKRKLGMHERGSALLVSLMVMVGLSLLGLAFVAVSETESAIANNERNGAQTLAVAEAGAKAVVDWFQDPIWARDQGLAPANDPTCSTSPCIKISRLISTATDNTGVKYGPDYYKSGATDVLFDRSYRVENGKFYGTEDNPDILINDRTAPTFLSGFNIRLFNTTVPGTMPTDTNACSSCDNVQGGRVTEIRIYAPPVDGGITNTYAGWTTAAGIPNARGFIYGGSRFGIATIRVTAVKYNLPQCGPYQSGCRALAERTVKFVIAEWPVPGPSGPLQSATSLANAGNVQIHWGRSTSEGSLDLTKTRVAVPWHDAYNIANIERGYDDKEWPVDVANADYKKRYAWLYELIGRSFEDAWYGARARGSVAQLPQGSPVQPHPMTWDGTDVTVDPTTGNAASSNMFQIQTKSDGVNYREVLFPRIDYNFWKQVAVAASDQGNVKYLQWVSDTTFRDRSGCSQDFELWVNTAVSSTCNGGKAPAGFYFFDTTDSTNPQNIVNPTNLTPEIALNGGTMMMKGFIYINTETYKTTGIGGVSGYYNMPGEPYRDIGYRRVEEDSTKGWYKQGFRPDEAVACDWNTGIGCQNDYKGGNGQWDWQDLAWSNGLTARNGLFDVFVAQKGATITRNSAPTSIAANTEYFVVPFTPGCLPGNNSCGTCTCSEPHEPYLNLVYPDASLPEDPTVARWQAPNSSTRRPKIMSGASPFNCTIGTPTQDQCTSNAYDRDGALVNLSPSLDGVLYIEGTNETTGNADYFGSVLIRRDFNNKGTPNVWFDEKLIKGDWPPKSFNFPRVYVSSEETDQ